MKTAVIALPLLLTFAAHAQVLQTSPVTITSPSSGNAALNTITSLSIPQFNVAGGTLQSISIVFLGSLTASAKLENLSAFPVGVTASDAGTYVLKRPDTSSIATVTPSASSVATLAAVDGVIDFDGTSGNTFADKTGTDSASLTLSTASDLALFSGAGNLSLTVSATAAPSAIGGPNLISSTATVGFASATVTYNYSVPEPKEYAAAVGLALVGFAAWRRRAARR